MLTSNWLQLRNKNTGPSLAWAQRHREQLAAADQRAAAQGLEFQLHQLAFLQCMTTQGAPCLCSAADMCCVSSESSFLVKGLASGRA